MTSFSTLAITITVALKTRILFSEPALSQIAGFVASFHDPRKGIYLINTPPSAWVHHYPRWILGLMQLINKFFLFIVAEKGKSSQSGLYLAIVIIYCKTKPKSTFNSHCSLQSTGAHLKWYSQTSILPISSFSLCIADHSIKETCSAVH